MMLMKERTRVVRNDSRAVYCHRRQDVEIVNVVKNKHPFSISRAILLVMAEIHVLEEQKKLVIKQLYEGDIIIGLAYQRQQLAKETKLMYDKIIYNDQMREAKSLLEKGQAQKKRAEAELNEIDRRLVELEIELAGLETQKLAEEKKTNDDKEKIVSRQPAPVPRTRSSADIPGNGCDSTVNEQLNASMLMEKSVYAQGSSQMAAGQRLIEKSSRQNYRSDDDVVVMMEASTSFSAAAHPSPWIYQQQPKGASNQSKLKLGRKIQTRNEPIGTSAWISSGVPVQANSKQPSNQENDGQDVECSTLARRICHGILNCFLNIPVFFCGNC